MSDSENRPPRHFSEELTAFIGLIAKMHPEFTFGALAWAIIGIAITLFFSVFLGSLSVFLSIGLSLSLALLFFCLIIAGTLTLMSIVIVIRFKVFLAALMSWLLSPNNKDGGKRMADETKINPLGWGILFFTFWLLLMTIPSVKEQTITWYMAWVSLGLSILMLISIAPYIRNWLSQPGRIRYIVMLVFYITLVGYTLTYIASVGAVDTTIRPMVVIVGFAWLMVYICILISKSSLILGIIACLIFIGTGIYYLATQQTDIGRLSALYCGVIAAVILVCSLTKPKWLSEMPLI